MMVVVVVVGRYMNMMINCTGKYKSNNTEYTTTYDTQWCMMVSDDEHDEPHDYQQARINLTSNLFLKSQILEQKQGEYFLPTHSEPKRSYPERSIINLHHGIVGIELRELYLSSTTYDSKLHTNFCNVVFHPHVKRNIVKGTQLQECSESLLVKPLCADHQAPTRLFTEMSCHC